MPKKGSLVSDIQIIDLIPGGDSRGVGIDADGTEYQIYFDSRTVAPGDVVSAKVLGKHDRRVQGRIENCQKSSAWRRAPLCPHFGVCGGCTLQHIQYSQQLILKEGIVRSCLGPLAAEVHWLPAIPCASENEFAFRNKMEFTASARAYQTNLNSEPLNGPGALGLFVPFCGNKVLDVTDCRLQPEIGNQIRNWLRERAVRQGLSYYHSSLHEGFLRTLLVRTNLLGEALVMFIVAEDQPETIRSLCQDFSRDFSMVKSVWYVVNTKLNDSYADLKPIHANGELYITEKLGSFIFRVGPLTFLQVNSGQTSTLYQRIIELANLTGKETVYDLYCGVGTITAWLAQYAKKVIGIEYVDSAVSAASEACIENGIPNVSFHAGDMKDLLVEDFFVQNGWPDIIVSDPPRAGMHPKALAVLNKSGAKRIVYVSCNPVSLARDLQVLTTQYRLVSIQTVDLMPQSAHIETLALLELL